MRRFVSGNNLKRFLLDENIYFNSKQIRRLLNIDESCLSRHLKRVLMIPGCQSEYMHVIYNNPKRKPRERRLLKHYNLNTVAAIAYRINNNACREFLGYYHRVLLSLHQRIAGPNYQIPMALTAHEFQAFANRYTPQYITDPLD